MANTLLSATAVTREALRVLHQKLNFVGSITREYDDSFARQGAKIGDTLKVRLPNEYTVRTGAPLDAKDIKEQSVYLKVATQKGVDLNFTSADLTLSLDDFSERVIEPAMSVLAANIEADAMSMYKDVAQSIWLSGAPTFKDVLNGRQKLVDALAPLNKRTANLNSQNNTDLVDALKGLFNDQKQLSEQYREGYMGRTAGFDFVENTLWPAHARGAAAGATYTTSTQSGVIPAGSETPISTITLATGTGAFKKGDVITIDKVFRVHPETKQSTGVLMQFVVANDAAGGAGAIDISPAIVTGGARQNVVVAAASATAPVLVAGSPSKLYGTSLLYQKGAFAFATADMQMPRGVDFSAREVFDGVSMRVVRQYDINNDRFPCRLDVLYGYRTLRPQLAARLHSNEV
jgi:hypothetical protein